MLITCILVGNMIVKLGLCIYMLQRYLNPEYSAHRRDYQLSSAVKARWMTEAVISLMVFRQIVRCEAQGHLINVYSTLCGLQSLSCLPDSCHDMSLLLFNNSVLGSMTFLFVSEKWFDRDWGCLRAPPFPLKTECSLRGVSWVGPLISKRVRNQRARRLINLLCSPISSELPFEFPIVFLLFGALVVVDRQSIQNGLEIILPPRKAGEFYTLLIPLLLLPVLDPFRSSVIAILSHALQIHELRKIAKYCIPSTRAFVNDDPYEPIKVDRPPWEESMPGVHDAVTPKGMLPECKSLTVVIPCYMPNEEGVLLNVLKSHKQAADGFPAHLHVIVVWNSPTPDKHEKIVLGMEEIAKDWPTFRHFQVMG